MPKHKTGKKLFDYIDTDAPGYEESAYPDIDFTWQEEDPESMRAICPRLFAASDHF